jgi:hypothetical protein
MAQIIQYKDRLLDTSVYPVTVAAAVYVRTGDNDEYLNTLDTVLHTKVESISVYKDDTLGGVQEYEYVSTQKGKILDASEQENVHENIGIQSIINEIESYVSNRILDYDKKQDKLQHGIDENTGNIKTINGCNILGHGNVNIVEFEHHVGVDEQFDINSSNAIMNKTTTIKVNQIDSSITSINQHIDSSFSESYEYIDGSIDIINNHIDSSIESINNHIDSSFEESYEYIDGSLNILHDFLSWETLN